MAERMRRSMEQMPVYSPAGLYLGHVSTFTPEKGPFNRILGKMARGLYFATFKERLPVECTPQVFYMLPHQVPPGLFKDSSQPVIAGGSPVRGVGGQTFEYCIRHHESAGGMMCAMKFFGTLRMVIGFLSEPSTPVEGSQT